MSAQTQVALVAPRRWLGANRGVPVTVVLAFLVLGLAVLCAFLPAIAPQDPSLIVAADTLQKPSAEHLLGTDQLGRDILSRLVAGARTSLIGPLLLAVGVTTLASILAVVAGFFGGRTDSIVSRFVDLFYSVPPLMVAIVLVGVTGGGFLATIVVLVVFGLPGHVRNLRAAVMDRVHLPYMEAAITLGLPTWRVVVGHLVPAIRPFILATFFLTFTFGIVELSSLSFLGLGVPPGSPDWGRMVAENRASTFGNVWGTAAPAICIVLLAVSTNLIGEWLIARYEKAGKER